MGLVSRILLALTLVGTQGCLDNQERPTRLEYRSCVSLPSVMYQLLDQTLNDGNFVISTGSLNTTMNAPPSRPIVEGNNERGEHVLVQCIDYSIKICDVDPHFGPFPEYDGWSCTILYDDSDSTRQSTKIIPEKGFSAYARGGSPFVGFSRVGEGCSDLSNPLTDYCANECESFLDKAVNGLKLAHRAAMEAAGQGEDSLKDEVCNP